MKNNMKTRGTNKKSVFWFFLILFIGCFNLTKSDKSQSDPDELLKEIQVKSVREVIVTDYNYNVNQNRMITYQQGPEFKQFLINGSGFNQLDLIPVTSNNSCEQTHQLNVTSIKTHKDNENLLSLQLEAKYLENSQNIYLCAFDSSHQHGKHLGESSLFMIDSSSNTKDHNQKQGRFRKSIDVGDDHQENQKNSLVSDEKQVFPKSELKINGFRIEHADKEPEMVDGVPEVRAGTNVILRLFGRGFTNDTFITFTAQIGLHKDPCYLTIPSMFKILDEGITEDSALVKIALPQEENDNFYYLCVREGGKHSPEMQSFVHQGSNSWMRLKSVKPLLPLWLQLIIIIICLCFSALFSGLNLGLMSLDRTDLKILCNTGSESEKRHARSIQPVRDHGNFLLCSILLGNVLVNSTFTILLDSLTSGLLAVIFSTLLIVIFGEITPQAICSRHGLAVGAKTIWITKFVMLITFPLSYPTSKILDYLLGEEIGNFYNRERLKELVKVTTDVNDLDKDEVNIISGVLELRKKTVGDIMTHIEDAYMLPIDSILDFATISEIMNSGFSRIPVYDGDRTNIITLLYIKDLAFVDTDDSTPLRTLCEFYQNPCHFVFDDFTLDVMFKQFKEGNKGHMAFVHRVNNDGEGDPFYETIGLVTLEDVIEELIQAEIMDETDVFTDNRKKVRRQRPTKQDFSVFVERRNDNQRVRISPQLTLATYQYLSATIDAFKTDQISETILRRLLNQDIVRQVKKGRDKDDPSLIIYQQGKPVDFFVLILEGRVEVTVGRENLVFESGPFTSFGIQALVQNIGIDSPQQQNQIMGSLQSLNMDAMLRYTFVPDYSVRATGEVIYLVVKRSLYLAAKRATLMEKSQKTGDHSSELMDDEVEKLLHSLDEDDPSLAHTPKASKPTSVAPSPTSNVLHNGPTTSHVQNHHLQNQESPHLTFTPSGRSHSIGYVHHPHKSTGDIDIDAPLLPRSKS